jgi:hypothetical protein
VERTTAACPGAGTHCVKVVSSDYGSVDWIGLTTYERYSNRRFKDGKVHVKFNDYYVRNSNHGRAVACHELGQVIGLGHNDSRSSCLYYAVPSGSPMTPTSDGLLVRDLGGAGVVGAEVGVHVGQDRRQLAFRLPRAAVLPVQHHDPAVAAAAHVLDVDVEMARGGPRVVRRRDEVIGLDQFGQPTLQHRGPPGARPLRRREQFPPAVRPEGLGEPGVDRPCRRVSDPMQQRGNRAQLGSRDHFVLVQLGPGVGHVGC